jgi:hypothetical protein
MILPSYSEQEILIELTEDYKYVKKKAKKVATDYMQNALKRGSYIRESQYDISTVKSKNGNNWRILVTINQTNKIPWYFSSCCFTEGDKRSKDFYLLRGTNTDKPYFIKITSHALKRFKERNPIEGVFDEKDGFDLEDIPCLLLFHRETIICARYFEKDFKGSILDIGSADMLSEKSCVFLMSRGNFFGERSENGNYLFKTYISVDMAYNEFKNVADGKYTRWENEAHVLHAMLYLHQFYNEELYRKRKRSKYLYKIVGDRTIELGNDSPMFPLKP